MRGPTRRGVLGGLGAALLLGPRGALAFGERSLVDIAELDLGAGTTFRPNAWRRLLYEVVHTTSVECRPQAVRVDPAEPELFNHPFSVIVATGGFEIPSDRALEQLARYLSYGGFLVIDDTTGAEHGSVDRAVRRLCEVLFPTRPLSPLPSSHSVFRSFFLLDRPVGRLARFPYLEGVTVGDNAPLIYVRNDLSGALDRGADGRPLHTPTPGGEFQRREALKLGINLVLYCLTSNYKKDQAHVRELMREGRLRTGSFD